MPHASYGFTALQRELLCHGVLQLVLHHAHIVSLQIVLVHVHVVFQILIAGGGCQREGVGIVAQRESGDEIVAAIAAWEGRCWLLCLARIQVERSIGEGTLVHILIVGRHIHLPSRVQSTSQHQLSACLLVVVSSLARGGIAEEACLRIVESAHHQGYVLSQSLIVRSLKIAVTTTAIAYPHVGALIVEGIARIESHQSALGILSVECALRTSQHVHTAQLIGVQIESRLAHHGYSVHVHTDGRAVHTAAYASHIDCRRETTAIVGHYEIGDIRRQLAQVADSQPVHLEVSERSAA